MASMSWEKVGRRWRVFWHVTLPDGTLDKGSKSFDDKTTAEKLRGFSAKFKEIKMLPRTMPG